jgi:polysaccharide biosynthesis protein PslH
MRILFLSQVIPYPPDAGPKVRIYHVLQYLASAGHEITLVAFRRPDDKPENIAQLERFCQEVHTVLMQRSKLKNAWFLFHSLLTNQPFLINRDSVKAMHQLLADLVARQSFHAVHADQLWMAQYALKAKAQSGGTVELLTVLDQHNAVYLIPKRLAAGTNNILLRAFLNLEADKLARYEVNACHQFDKVVWVTDEDRQALNAVTVGQAPLREGLTIPISVDLQSKPIISRQESANRVTFVGGLHWPPNAEGVTWFLSEVWPKIHEKVPAARLTIIGKDPPTAVKTAAQVENVEVAGYVTDLMPYLSETAAFIVPLHAGGGMRVKILDAWSWGLPIVSTTIGAEGLHYQDGNDLIIADNADAFARAVIGLFSIPELASRLSAAGRQTAEEHYDWRQRYRTWDEVYSGPA